MESSLVRLTELSKLAYYASRAEAAEATEAAEAADFGGDRVEMKARVTDLWSRIFRWDVQLAGSQLRDRRKIFTHTRAVKDVTLQDVTVNAACVASVRAIGRIMEPREDKVRWFRIKREVELV